MKLFKKKPKEVNIGVEEKQETLNISNKEEKSIFEEKRRSLHDLIATEYDFSDPKKVVIGDNLYAKNMYIAFLPNELDFVSSFHSLYNFGDIDTSIYINPVDIETSKAELSKLRTNLATEVLESGGNINRADDMLDKEAEARRLRDEVKNGLNKLYDVSILATIYEKDERSLNNNADRLRELLGQGDLGIRNGAYFQEEIFFSNKPICQNKFNLSHTFDKRSLASLFPFTSNNIAHENGVMLGLNIDNARPLFFDNFDNSMTNYNVFVFGPSGFGKSTLIKSFSARSGTLDTVQNIALDIEPEYGIVAEQMGGVNIVLEPRGKTVINLFDVTAEKEEDEATGRIIEYINLDRKINSVTDQLMVLAKGFVGDNKYYDDMTRSIIRECVFKTYEPMNLTSDPDSLYEYIDTGITKNRVKKKPPTMSEWYFVLEEEARNNTTETYRPYYDYLLLVMSNFVRVKNGGLVCFDGLTTPDVKLGYDIPFINFDLSKLHEKTELPLAQYVIADFIREQIIKRNVKKKGEKPHKIRFIIDEAWRLVKYKQALDFLIDTERRGRKKNTSTWVLTQQFDEFYNEDTSVVIKQSFTKFFLRPDNVEVDVIKDVFKLTEGEINFLRTSEKGEVLMKAGSVSAKVKILIPDFEMDFIQTNQNAEEDLGGMVI
ncbi:MAG: hypothetical protein M0Q88_02700 [Bacilli bacterium]|nr:hypothetical protein [Bacilli bacterium]